MLTEMIFFSYIIVGFLLAISWKECISRKLLQSCAEREWLKHKVAFLKVEGGWGPRWGCAIRLRTFGFNVFR